MVRARPLALLAAGLVGFVLVLLALRWALSQAVTVPAPAIVPVLVGGFAVVVVVLGWRVRQFVRGKVSMDPIAASRVAALAVSAAFVGAIMAGVGIAQVVAVAGLTDAPAARGDAVVGAITAVTAVVLVVAGLLAQSWCELPDDGDEPDDEDPPANRAG